MYVCVYLCAFGFVCRGRVQARKDKRAAPDELSALEKVNASLLEGRPARSAGLTEDEKESIKSLMLLTLKPVIYAANVADSDLATGNELSNQVFDYAAKEGNKAVLVSAQVLALATTSTEIITEYLYLSTYMHSDKPPPPLTSQ